MLETTYEISVSNREIDRSRLIEIGVQDAEGKPLAGVHLALRIQNDGTFDVDEEVATKQVVSSDGGVAYVTWWEWPRDGERRDYVSVINVVWDDERAFVWLDNLYE